MLYQPSNISPDEIYGTGTVDITQDLSISWRVSGDSAMNAYKIDIYQNDANSTSVYSTGKVTVSPAFWGVNYAGVTQYYTATIDAGDLGSAGMANGNEYKFLITQWWTANDSVTQFTPSLFITRATPTLTIDAFTTPLTERSATFTATYSQTQGDAIAWVRWELADVSVAGGSNVYTVFQDTGPIYGTGELQTGYDGFLTGNSYGVRCTVETENGIQVTTGWTDFSASYALDPASGGVNACQLAGNACVWVTWDKDPAADGYSVMRQTVGATRLVKIADVDDTVGQIQDYSARSCQSYIYYVFPTSLSGSGYLTAPMVSGTVKVQYWGWAIVETEQTAENEFSVLRSYIFKYGTSGGPSEGQFSNNNSPQISQNFTRYPTRQGATPNYLTGSVSGFVGTVSADKSYADAISQSDALFALSNTTNALFLHDPKGHFLRIHTSGALTLAIDHKSAVMPQTVTVPWVEIGSAADAHLILYPGGDFYPTDKIILTTVSVNPKTGMLLWDVPDDYLDETTTLSLSGGILSADPDGPFTPAELEIDEDSMLVATVEE